MEECSPACGLEKKVTLVNKEELILLNTYGYDIWTKIDKIGNAEFQSELRNIKKNIYLYIDENNENPQDGLLQPHFSRSRLWSQLSSFL